MFRVAKCFREARGRGATAPAPGGKVLRGGQDRVLRQPAVPRERIRPFTEGRSSGTLHFGLTAEKLLEPHESLPWNPIIARVLHRRGVIKQWGRGTLKMAELAAKAGQPRPEIEEVGGCVMVRFFPNRYVPPTNCSRPVGPPTADSQNP